MIEHEIVVTVAGKPKTKGSMKCIGRRGRQAHVVVEDNKGTAPWRAELAGWFRKVTQTAEKGQPLRVVLSSTLKRPDYHYGTGRNARMIKERYLDAYPVGHDTGDVDKLGRLVLDAIQDTDVLPDDCQVVSLTTDKAYVDGPGLGRVLGYPGVVVQILPVAPPNRLGMLPIGSTS